MAKGRFWNTTTARWVEVDAKNADTLGGKLPSEFALASHGYHPSTGQQSALAGSYGTPGTANKFVTETDPRFAGASNSKDTECLIWMGVR